MEGLFVTFEGPDGCGKTTISKIVTQKLEEKGFPVVFTREPGGTPVGERIREILMTQNISAHTELLLFNAARVEHLHKIILPALLDKKIVISDRFTDSTIAYQSYGRGIQKDKAMWICDFATCGAKPDLTILIDVPPEIGLERRKKLDQTRFDQEDLGFHEMVRFGFMSLYQGEPDRFVWIDGTKSIEEVSEHALQAVLARIEKLTEKGVTRWSR